MRGDCVALSLKRLSIPDWVAVAALGLLALGLRLTYVWQVAGTPLVAPEELDPGFYYGWAKQIASGAWLGTQPFVQSPLYAYFLALVIKLVGPDVGRILAVQAVIGCGTVLLTYVAGRRLFGHLHGLLAGLLIALYGPFIFFEGMVMKTFLSPFLTVLLLILLDRAREASEAALPAPGGAGGPGPGRATRLFLLAGIVYGLTTLDRDNFILLAPALALLAFWLRGGLRRPGDAAGRRTAFAAGLRAAGAFTLGTVLMVAPVTLRNWVVSKELVLLTTGGGEVFFIGNNEEANGLYVPPPFVRPDPKYEHADFIARASEISGRTLSPMESSWFWFRQGMQFVTGEPLLWGRLLVRKMVHFWNFYELPDNLDYSILQIFSPLLGLLNGAFPPPGWPAFSLPTGRGWLPVRLHLYSTFGTVAPLGLLGIVLTRRSWRRLVPAYVLLFGYMATVLLFFNFARFRVPVVPILALFAAESLCAIGRVLRRAWGLAVAFAARSGDMVERARALRPGRGQAAAILLLVASLSLINAEFPRGVVPAIEQALTIGNTYYAQLDPEKALRSYTTGLILLGEGPPGPAGDALIRGLGPAVTREALLRELEVEAVARGPQFKGIHIGIHHGIGIALVQQAQTLLDQGKRPEALPLLDRAIAQFNEALRLSPAYLLSIRKMARAYLLKGDNAQAIEWLQKGLDLWPEDLQARLELAEILYKGGDFKRALRHLDEARTYNKGMDDRQQAEICFFRALVFYQGLDQPGRALYNFERAMALDPGQPQSAEIRRAILDLRARGFQPLSDDLFEAAEPPASR
jgi:tetratricopeptide (TPR) repeat protein